MFHWLRKAKVNPYIIFRVPFAKNLGFFQSIMESFTVGKMKQMPKSDTKDVKSEFCYMLKTPVTPECAAEISNIGPCQPGKEETFKSPEEKANEHVS